MAAETNTQGASAPQFSTASHAFCRADTNGQLLFSVNDGVQMIDAIEMAQTYLAAAGKITGLVAMDTGNDAVFGAHYLVELAAAVIGSIVQYDNDQKRGIRGEQS